MPSPNKFLCHCPACGKDVVTNRPNAPYSKLTRNKADLLIAFYHLGFASDTKPTEASMQAALDNGALIHEQCCIRTNQVAGNPPLLAEYNRLRAAREVPLEPAPPFQNPDRSAAALLNKFAADAYQQRAAPPRARATPAPCATPANEYLRAPAAATAATAAAAEATPYVKQRVRDTRSCINSAALTPLVPPREWRALDAYLRERPVHQPGEVAAFAGHLVLALPHVAFHAAGVLDFVLTAVPRMHALSGAPGGVFLLSTDAQVASLLAPVAAASALHSAAAAVVRRAAAATDCMRRSTLRRVDVHEYFLEFGFLFFARRN